MHAQPVAPEGPCSRPEVRCVHTVKAPAAVIEVSHLVGPSPVTVARQPSVLCCSIPAAAALTSCPTPAAPDECQAGSRLPWLAGGRRAAGSQGPPGPRCSRPFREPAPGPQLPGLARCGPAQAAEGCAAAARAQALEQRHPDRGLLCLAGLGRDQGGAPCQGCQ